MAAVLGRLLAAMVRLEAGDDLPPKKGSFTEAIAWHRHRDPMPREQFDELDAALRQRAFVVAGLAQLDLVMDVHRALDRAVHDGTTLHDFKKEVGEKLEGEWAETGGSHASLENIFRTNVQTAYGAGRYQQAKAVADYRPYWQFDAIEDMRTSPWCRPIGGIVRHSDDPWWRTHVPPLHYQCRSSIRTLTEAQAAREGVTPDERLPLDENGEPLTAMPGFGAAPETAADLATSAQAIAHDRLAAVATEAPDLAHAATRKLLPPGR